MKKFFTLINIYAILLSNNKNGVFMKISKFAKTNGVTQRTVWNWIND